ncbi:MAG: histidine phosphatase family protein [Ferruginibacter sp.]
MKKLIIVRHAKSSWANLGQTDYERPLNERGQKDAPEMALRLKNRKITIDRFVSSPAKRAKQTCRAFCKLYECDSGHILFIEKLYHAPKNVFYEVVEALDNADDTVIIFSHNPGITDFVNSLCKDVFVDNMPTCSIFAVQADLAQWTAFEKAEKTFLFFDYPKNPQEPL